MLGWGAGAGTATNLISENRESKKTNQSKTIHRLPNSKYSEQTCVQQLLKPNNS